MEFFSLMGKSSMNVVKIAMFDHQRLSDHPYDWMTHEAGEFQKAAPLLRPIHLEGRASKFYGREMVLILGNVGDSHKITILKA
jgi:hypothetical protein